MDYVGNPISILPRVRKKVNKLSIVGKQVKLEFCFANAFVQKDLFTCVIYLCLPLPKQVYLAPRLVPLPQGEPRHVGKTWCSSHRNSYAHLRHFLILRCDVSGTPRYRRPETCRTYTGPSVSPPCLVRTYIGVLSDKRDQASLIY